MNLKLVFPRLRRCLLMLVMLTNAAVPVGVVGAGPLQADAPAARLTESSPIHLAHFKPEPAGQAPSPDLGLSAMSALTTTIVISNTYSWVKTWGDTGDVQATNVAVDKLGNVFVVGEYDGRINFDPAKASANSTFTSTNGTVDAFLTKFNASGQFQWTRVWGAGFITDTAGYNRGWGRDAANGVAVDDLGNAYVAGLFQNSVNMGAGIVITSNAPDHSNNIFIAKFAANGTTTWARAWGGTTGSEAYSIVVDAAHGAVYVEGDWSTNPNTGIVDFNPGGSNGLRQNRGFYDAFLSKYDLNGNFQWVQTWGGSQYDDGPGVAVDDTGNVYVCGMYGSQNINFDPAGSEAGKHPASDNSSTFLDIFLTKFDANGNWQWVRTWGGAGVEDAGATVTVDHAGNVYAIGRFKCTSCNFNVGSNGPVTPGDLHSTNGNFDVFLSKFKADGTFQWTQTWGGAKADQGGALVVDEANNVYVGGIMEGVINPSTYAWTEGDAFFRKFTPDGAFQWERRWGGSQTEWLLGLAVDKARNFYAAGSFQGTVDFDPGSPVDNHTATGGENAYLTLYGAQTIVLTATVWLPEVTR
jgi:hypothetical protein